MSTDDAVERRCIPVSLAYPDEVIADVESRYDGMRVVPRTVENALRRYQLKTYRVGLKRYTTPEFIDEWLESCIAVAKS